MAVYVSMARAASAAPCALDPNYGVDGRVRFVLPEGPVSSVDAVLDTAGRLLIAGRVSSAPSKYALIRLDRGGAFDASFDGDGVVIKEPPATTGVGLPWPSVAIDSSGAVYLSGRSRDLSAGTDAMFVAKYDDTGQPDAGFGSAGTASYPDSQTYATDLAVDSSGRALVAILAPSAIALRFTATGTLDNTFGNGGLASVPGLGSGLFPKAIAVDGERVVVGGDSALRVWVARVLSNGVPDPAFGNGGYGQLTTGKQNTDVNALALDNQSGIVLVGADTPPPPPFGERYQVIAARFDSDGMPVAGFGNGGLLSMSVEPGNVVEDTGRGVHVDPDGAVEMVVKTVPNEFQELEGEIALLRVDAAGNRLSQECDAVTRLPTESGTVGWAGEIVADGRRKLMVGLDASGEVVVFAVEPGLLFRSGFE